MRIVVALGGNALLRRGEAMTAEQQRANVRTASEQLAPAMAFYREVGASALIREAEALLQAAS